MSTLKEEDIARCEDARDLTSLIDVADDRNADKWLRVSAIHALRKLGDARAIDGLIAALRDEDGNGPGKDRRFDGHDRRHRSHGG
jgi:HEAT repeat protein